MWPSCHSWHDVTGATLSAMTTLLVLSALLLLLGLVATLLGAVRGDGYGHRPPPASHWSDDDHVAPAR